MTSYIVTAQSYSGILRITRVISATSEAEVLLLVSANLDEYGFYPISIIEA